VGGSSAGFVAWNLHTHDVPAFTVSHPQVNIEKYNKKNDLIRAASLLPRQIREAKARRAKLVEAEKDWVSKGQAKKVAADTLKFIREVGSLDEAALKRLEDNLNAKDAGLGLAIRQVCLPHRPAVDSRSQHL
jgi:hypothetical protein